MTGSATPADVVGDGEGGSEGGGGVPVGGAAVEIAQQVGPAAVEDGPGPAGKLAGDRAVGLDVVVVAFDCE
jgi:hypothetical protein